MTLVQLRHLLSLAQTGSFSRSASALFLTQPALSCSIRALELELGQPLFDRIGQGSGPGAMLMTPLLMHMAKHHPQLRLEISRGRTELLERGLRERTIDAPVVDTRSLAPAPDLRASETHEMRGAFLCRRGHPLLRRRGGANFDQLRGIRSHRRH